MRPRGGGVLSDFKLFETDEFVKALGKVAPAEAVWIRKKLLDQVYPQLRSEPFLGRNIRKLRGYAPETWRYRVGRFRVFYAVDQAAKVIFLLTVDRRRDAYR